MKIRGLPAIILALAIPMSAGAQQQPPAGPGILRQLNDSFAAVFEKAAPSVVIIEANQNTPKAIPGLPQGIEFFLGDANGRPSRAQPNIGSGFVIRQDGYILTNNHVVEGSDDVTVKLHDGRRFQADVVGLDARSDLAVIKIQANGLSAADLGDSDAVKVGQFAFAIGTPMELPYTFTVGVVSAKGRNLALGRSYDEFIQTDASINPGNSGGPLCDIDGKVVGINTLISGVNRGLGFAIPINLAKNVADQLIAGGHVRRPWLGIAIAGLEEDEELKPLFPGLNRGVVVRGLEPAAPAQAGGLLPGDVILKVDDVQVSLASDLQRQILGKKIGQKVGLEIWRAGRVQRVAVTTGEQPDTMQRASLRPRRSQIQRPLPDKPSAPAGPAIVPGPAGMTVRDAVPQALREYGIRRQASGGVVVAEVVPMSPAAVAGLEPGDIITEAGGRPVLGKPDFDRAMKSMDPERGLLLLFERDGRRGVAILKP